MAIYNNNNCDLQTCLLCRLCLKEWKPAIEAHRQTFQFKKGALIFSEGDPVRGIYFVLSGTVKVHKHWGVEKELILRFAKKGTILGHRGLGYSHIYPVSATAIGPASACFVPLEFFQSTLKVNHDLLYELMLFYARELQLSEKKMRDLAHMPVKGRLAQSLLFLHQQFGTDEGGHIFLELSRQDLASYAGTTYETVFRFMNELVAEQLIRTSGKKIAVVDEERLQQFVSGLESSEAG